MRHLILTGALLIAGIVTHAQGGAQPAPLDCSAGPLARTFGGTPWLVYGCSDRKTVVVMSAPGSPAMPFYFTLFHREGRYVVAGEGSGSRDATAKAHADLVKLSDREIESLLAATGVRQ